jgi:hypothetical protein
VVVVEFEVGEAHVRDAPAVDEAALLGHPPSL